MLPHVVRFNGPRANDLYARMVPGADAAQDAAGALALRLETLRSTAGLPERLRAVGVEHRALPEMADEASRQWTLGFNPRQTLRDDLVKLYETAF